MDAYLASFPSRLAYQRELTAGERFAGLVDRQSRFVFRVAYSVLRNVQDAEDAAQETFLKLYRTGSWDSIEDERAFLARAAWRVATSRRRQHSEPPPDSPCPRAGPEQAAIHADSAALLHRLIDALPEDLRKVIALSTLEELNSQQIGAILDIPEGTVRTRLMRARAILKSKLEALGGVNHG